MISDLLPRYYEANGDNLTYSVLRSIVIEGHEVAWMQFDGTVKFDITGQGREGQSFTGRGVYCECDFGEGVGWEVKDGQLYSLDGERQCLKRKAALYLRQLELREEYSQRFAGKGAFPGDSYVLKRNAQAIILDLVEKAKAGEFIGEDGNGASFWGGYFYLQTVAAITDVFIGHLWEDVHALMKKKKIGLDGAVIQPYRKPPPPKWEEYLRIEEDGYIGIALLPGHRDMAREWKLKVLRPDGKPAFSVLPGEALLHDPVFGPDVEDVERVKERLHHDIAMAREHS